MRLRSVVRQRQTVRVVDLRLSSEVLKEPRRFRLASKGTPRRLAILFGIIAVALVICWWMMIRMSICCFRMR